MRDWRLFLAAVVAVLSPIKGQSNGVGLCHVPSSDNGTIYDFQMQNVHKNGTIDFGDYKGKVVLIVNVATY